MDTIGIGVQGPGCGVRGDACRLPAADPALNRGCPAARPGFTLIELMAVMVIMALLMSVAVVEFIQIGHAAGMRASALNVQAALGLARQTAITYRTKTRFSYSNLVSDTELPVGCYTITTITNGVTNTIGGLNRLDMGIVFTNPVSASFLFGLDGSCEGGLITDTDIWLMERDKKNASSNAITLYPLTGRIKIKY